MILWGLWGERNQLVWRHESRTAHLIVEGALTILDEWKMARAVGEHQPVSDAARPATCRRWHPPQQGTLKCNVDAAFQESEGQWGWGIAIRNHPGSLLSHRTGWMRGVPEVREGEALTLLDALIWVQAVGVERAVFETDST
ncbi:hypothetical protein LINPERHAP1_LOCUS4492 [Linum perenne]